VPTSSLTMACLDDKNLILTSDNDKQKDCSWITGNSQNTPDESQRTYCTKSHVKSVCKATCQFCTCWNNKFKISTCSFH
jgi:hypothetical protein